MGSCNCSHKLSGRTGDEVPGISQRARRRGGKGRESMLGGGVKKEKLSVGGFFFFSSFFFLVLSLVGVHHVTMYNWPVVTPELYKQISRETCQPEGLQR